MANNYTILKSWNVGTYILAEPRVAPVELRDMGMMKRRR